MKNWFKSKTIWFNVISGIATLTSWIMGLVGQPYIIVFIVIVNTICNILLRFVTRERIKI